MSEDDVRRILRHPATVIGSDSLYKRPTRIRDSGAPFRACRPLARATTLPARRCTRRPATSAEVRVVEPRLVRESYAADLVLFDATTVRDVATFTDPQRPAEGIRRCG
jgi:N-acyl-D-amino-acid deacylase